MDAAYQERVLTTIRNLKLSTARSGNWFAIFDRDECMTSLDPVTWQDVDDPDSIKLLASWREGRRIRFRRSFPSRSKGRAAG